MGEAHQESANANAEPRGTDDFVAPTAGGAPDSPTPSNPSAAERALSAASPSATRGAIAGVETPGVRVADGGGVRVGASRSDDRATFPPQHRDVEVRRASPPERHPLLRSFGGGVLDWKAPERGPWPIVLAYAFDEEKELRDFRALAGRWALQNGKLSGSGDAILDTIAWFVTPVEIEIEVVDDVELVLHFGELRIAPGRGPDAEVWIPDSDDAARRVSKLTGRARVRIDSNRVVLSVGGEDFRFELDTPLPAEARVGVEVRGGGRLERMSVRGALQPLWAAERTRRLSERR